MSATSRMQDRQSAIVRIFDLVASETVTPFVRWVSFSLSFVMGFLAWGPLFYSDSRAYQNPVFDGVFRFASPAAWGCVFFAAGALMLLTALTGRAAIYICAVTLSTMTLGGWSAMVSLEAWTSEEAVLTSGALGLYLGTFTGIVGLAVSPRQLAAEKPIVRVTEDNHTVPLRRVG